MSLQIYNDSMQSCKYFFISGTAKKEKGAYIIVKGTPQKTKTKGQKNGRSKKKYLWRNGWSH